MSFWYIIIKIVAKKNKSPPAYIVPFLSVKVRGMYELFNHNGMINVI